MDADNGPSTIEVEVADHQAHVRAGAGELAARARRVLRREGVDRASISVVLVDDATIHELNRRHLGHDWPTDVITFALSEPGDEVLAGEVILSAEMAARTAREAGVDPMAELCLYLVHGLLHLVGCDDRTDEAAEEMRRREASALGAEGLINTFPMAEPGTGSPSGRG